MSLHEYQESQELARRDVSFYGLIMAAMRRADDVNLTLLRQSFPLQWRELRARYDAPGGRLPGEVA